MVRPADRRGLYAWELEKGTRDLKVRVDGRLVVIDLTQRLDAALAGLGLAYLPEDVAQPYLVQGRLKRVREDWCALFRDASSIARADASPPRPLSCWSMRCVIGANAAAPAAEVERTHASLSIGELRRFPASDAAEGVDAESVRTVQAASHLAGGPRGMDLDLLHVHPFRPERGCEVRPIAGPGADSPCPLRSRAVLVICRGRTRNRRMAIQ